MTDEPMFEVRLIDALGRYASDDPTVIDAHALARSIAADAPRRRGWSTLTSLRLPGATPSLRVAVALGLLLLLAIIGIAAGGLVLRQLRMFPTPVNQGLFQPTGSMVHGREQAAATTLADGRVLITGGFPLERTAELFDPTTGTFAPAGELTAARWGHTATLLADGRVLIAGGLGLNEGGSTSLLFSAEVWDPLTMSSGPTGSTAGGHLHSAGRQLADGRILISGGTLMTPGPSAAPEVWDPETGRFSPAVGIPGADAPAGALLEGDRVVWTDGTSAFLWDPRTATSQAIGNLLEPRGAGATVTSLADNRVLVIGGMSPDGTNRLAAAEIVDPVRSTIELVTPMEHARSDNVAELLADGRVLVAGGDDAGGRSAELFEPP